MSATASRCLRRGSVRRIRIRARLLRRRPARCFRHRRPTGGRGRLDREPREPQRQSWAAPNRQPARPRCRWTPEDSSYPWLPFRWWRWRWSPDRAPTNRSTSSASSGSGLSAINFFGAGGIGGRNLDFENAFGHSGRGIVQQRGMNPLVQSADQAMHSASSLAFASMERYTVTNPVHVDSRFDSRGLGRASGGRIIMWRVHGGSRIRQQSSMVHGGDCDRGDGGVALRAGHGRSIRGGNSQGRRRRAGMRWPIPGATCWIAGGRCTSAGGSWRTKRRICSSAAARSSRARHPI